METRKDLLQNTIDYARSELTLGKLRLLIPVYQTDPEAIRRIYDCIEDVHRQIREQNERNIKIEQEIIEQEERIIRTGRKDNILIFPFPAVAD